MPSYIHPDFLLETPAARRLYHEHAESQPILDYHCHLAPAAIAADRPFENLFDVWLAGDHYKWRAMRANGIAEHFCTGDASPEEKFQAWASTVPRCLRNPLYHWTHLELKRVFGIDELLGPATAADIWRRANAVLTEQRLSPRALMARFDVRVVCTTDDPADSLDFHAALRAERPTGATQEKAGSPRVYPTFRPDRALAVDRPAAFNPWVDRLAQAAQTEITNFDTFLAALARRHADFHALGCRLSDHGLLHAFAQPCSQTAAAGIFGRARSGQRADSAEHARFASFLMLFFARLDAERGWTKQLHLGARRNTNTRAFESLGPDTGFDSIADAPQVEPLLGFLDHLDREAALPKIIVYNLNPADHYAIATALGNFQGAIPGKMQWGAAWWFLDTRQGMEQQLDILSNVGLLSRFVGMLTDSRSFLSYPRHEYFRRILCNLLGRELDRGELPPDEPLVGSLVRDLCYANAARYFGLEI